MKYSKKKWYCKLLLNIGLLILFFLNYVVAAVSVVGSPGAPLVIMPNVDIVRQVIATLSVEADQAYSIEINDNNAGILINGAAVIPYRISYNNNSEISLTTNPTIVESGSSVTNGASTIAVTILGSDTASAAAGDYTATLVVTITGF